MSMCNVYDEDVYIGIVRGGVAMAVHFCELKEGDEIADGPHQGLVVAEDAHESGDACYEGWLFHGNDGEGYFPEDFGADLIKSYDENEEPVDGEDEALAGNNSVYIVFYHIPLTLYKDSAGHMPPEHKGVVAVYGCEEDARNKVNELEEKDLELVELGCDPTRYSYEKHSVC